MKKTMMLGLMAMMVFLFGCGKASEIEKSSAASSNEQTSIAGYSNPVDNSEAAQHNTSEGLNPDGQKTELFQYQTLPEDTVDAMTTEKCRLLPLPDENAKELGFLWQHHRITIIEKVQVTYQDRNQLAVWYLVKLPPTEDHTHGKRMKKIS